MQILISIFLFVLVSFVAFTEQGTMSTDDTRASRAEASLSGSDEKSQLQAEEENPGREEEEVRIDDDEYDDSATEIDEEKMDQYEQDVQY